MQGPKPEPVIGIDTSYADRTDDEARSESSSSSRGVEETCNKIPISEGLKQR